MGESKRTESARGRVLVVDDEAPMCELLSEFLSPHGFESRSSYDGNGALALMEREPFDVVISDVRMPGMSGLALLEEARHKYPQTAFLMATAVDDVDSCVNALHLGAYDYLLKPLDLSVVLKSVRSALEMKRKEMEIEARGRILEEMIQLRTKQLNAAIKRTELSYDETLEALGAALDLHDTETEGHSRRVSMYSIAIARAMSRSKREVKQIERGAYLHDIGKIGIPDSLLFKPAKLTPEETSVMETHARVGYDLVRRIAFLAPAAEIVLTHHERFDGTGYPQGLMGEEIPLGARIFAVADTLDAMTADRSYRRALPSSAAREEILREAGRQFDPAVVKAFLSIPETTWSDIRARVNKRARSLPAHPLVAEIAESFSRIDDARS